MYIFNTNIFINYKIHTYNISAPIKFDAQLAKQTISTRSANWYDSKLLSVSFTNAISVIHGV